MRLARRQPPDDRQPPVAAAIERALRAADDRLGAERRRDVEGAADLHAAEIALRDADDRERVAVERDRFADHIGAAAVFALPESVTQDRDRSVGPAAAPVVVGGEQSGRCAACTPSVSKKRPLTNRPCALRVSPPAFRLKRGLPYARDADQDVLVIADVLPLRVGQRGVGDQRMPLEAEDHQPIRLVDRQRLQDQRVDQREDRDVGADAQRQGEQRHAADDRRLPHLAEGELRSRPSEDTQSHAPFDAHILRPVGRISYVCRKGKQAPFTRFEKWKQVTPIYGV